MKPEIKAELWRLAQAAFDAQSLASEDPAVLDLLVEHPELACEMDQVLIVEQRLQIVQAAVPTVASRQHLVLGVAALVAAALAIAWVPSLWDQSAPEWPAEAIANSFSQESVGGATLPVSEPNATVASIESFELAIVRHRPRSARAYADQGGHEPTLKDRKPQILSFTSSRTRSAPRGANTTY